MRLNQRDWEEKAILQELRQEQRKREMWLRYAVTTSVSERQAFAFEVQRRAIEILRTLGLNVQTTSHKCSYDLIVENILIEVKGAHWQHKRNRYQANIRSYVADVVLFNAVNGSDHWFIVPMSVIGTKRTIEVYSSYPLDNYNGLWASYLERWDLLLEFIEKSPRTAIQLRLSL